MPPQAVVRLVDEMFFVVTVDELVMEPVWILYPAMGLPDVANQFFLALYTPTLPMEVTPLMVAEPVLANLVLTPLGVICVTLAAPALIAA